MTASQKAKALGVVSNVDATFASSGRNRSLLTIIKNAATDGFKALGNVGEGVNIPLHQAMVVLSTGFGELADQGDGAQLEVRASWTPDASGVGASVEAWSDLLCRLAGLPPTPDTVGLLPNRRAARG